VTSRKFKEKWDWKRLAKYAFYGRGKRWAIAQMKLVESGEKNIDQVLESARRKPDGYKQPDYQIFTGKNGRKYTPEMIVLETERRGNALSMDGARQRIYRVKKDPYLEATLLESVSVGHLKKYLKEQDSAARKQNQQDLDDVWFGRKSANEVFGREVNWTVS